MSVYDDHRWEGLSLGSPGFCYVDDLLPEGDLVDVSFPVHVTFALVRVSVLVVHLGYKLYKVSQIIYLLDDLIADGDSGNIAFAVLDTFEVVVVPVKVALTVHVVDRSYGLLKVPQNEYHVDEFLREFVFASDSFSVVHLNGSNLVH